MKKNRTIYVYHNKEEILCSGIKAVEFIKYNSKNINNLLLLETEISTDNVELLLESKIFDNNRNKYRFRLLEGKANICKALEDFNINFGTLSFVDYNNKENIDKLSKEEVMQMLYFMYFQQKLNLLINDKIQNNYAYYCHDNDWYIKIFCRDNEDYIKTLLNILLTKIDIKMCNVTNVNTNVEILMDIIKKGAIFKVLNNRINIYEVGHLSDIDDMFNKSKELMNSNTMIYSLSVRNSKIEFLVKNK